MKPTIKEVGLALSATLNRWELRCVRRGALDRGSPRHATWEFGMVSPNSVSFFVVEHESHVIATSVDSGNAKLERDDQVVERLVQHVGQDRCV